jgi:GTP cyclohydrolase III
VAGQAAEPAQGVIAADGTFQVGTFQRIDGAMPGEYRVAVFPAIPEEALDNAAEVARYKSTVDRRYQNVQTTPIQVTVKEDRSANHFDIVLETTQTRRR